MVYDTGKRVKDVSYAKRSGLTIKFEDSENGTVANLYPDLVIAADGANSTIRKLLVPKLEAPYSGYLTWRGAWYLRRACRKIQSTFFMVSVSVHADRSYIVLSVL